MEKGFGKIFPLALMIDPYNNIEGTYMKRRSAISKIRNKIGSRNLSWFGLRSSDSALFSDYGVHASSYGIIAPVDSNPLHCLESRFNRRVNWKKHKVFTEEISHEALTILRQLRMQCDTEETIVVPYQSFDRLCRVTSSAKSHLFSAAPEDVSFLNHKYKVEQELENIGVRTLGYFKVRDLNDKRLRQILDVQPLVVRLDRSVSGENIWNVKTYAELVALVSSKDEEIHQFSFSPFLENGISLNISGCLNRKGQVSVHSLNQQVIGCSQLTERRFGYCGNDFGVARELDKHLIKECVEVTQKVGSFLHKCGFVGAYGVDLLLQGDRLYYIELNPRFQGSSPFGAQLEKETDSIDIFSAHLMAWLDIDYSVDVDGFIARTMEQPAYGRVFLKNTSEDPLNVYVPQTAYSFEQLPDANIRVTPGGTIFALIIPQRITTDGRNLFPEVSSEIGRISSAVYGDQGPDYFMDAA